MFNITTKLEINIRKSPSVATDVIGLNILMVKNKIPALIIDPEFIEPMFFERTKVNGTYKIITTVDFYNGRAYALDKLKDLPRFALESEGLEIMVSPNRTDKESLNELKTIVEFLKKINPLLDIRWCLGLRTRSYDSVKFPLTHFKTWPCSFIRTDINLQVPNLTVEKHRADIAYIKSLSGLPIKVSGNVDINLIRELTGINRFDVSVTQFKNIVKALKENPDLGNLQKKEVKKEEIKKEEVKKEEVAVAEVVEIPETPVGE